MARSARYHLSRRLSAAALVGVAIAFALAPASLAATRAVKIVGFAFVPASVTVSVGDTVSWSNGDAVTHTATADDGSWTTGSISGGSKKSLTFSTAGTFPYHCAIHASMHGTLVVQAAAAPPPTDTAAPDRPAGGGSVVALLALAAVVGLALGRRRFGAVRT